jgi:tRNA pseudouridine38-40 synthase
MPRFFLEVAYKGTLYSGFQVQENAVTIQSEVEKAFALVQRAPVMLTGSSRTDAGVHALQNYFHFDWEGALHPQLQYKMNAVLPPDIAVKSIRLMHERAHARFDAVQRAYEYHIYKFKNPFLRDTAFHFPYKLNMELLQEAAAYIKEQTYFYAFCKTNVQVTNFSCTIHKSEWVEKDGLLIYNIGGNRFLRGMVRLLTATQLKVARGIMEIGDFRALFSNEQKCGFSVPAHGLYLVSISFPDSFDFV